MPDFSPIDENATVRLQVPRHLQDCNGYCGPACVMMVLSGENRAAQHELFRRVRDHAKLANDRRPVKAPAESLLTLLETPQGSWKKVFDPEADPVAALIVQALETVRRPCLLLVSKGMHWVVAFGRSLREDGSVAGVLLRDPAWAGMPNFFGLTVMPDNPTFVHTADTPCACLAADHPPGSVHERYISMDELLSPRGLQGSPDWDQKGALALVPAELDAVGILPKTSSAAPALLGLTPGQAALQEARDHGLFGRADSPPEWDRLLQAGRPGAPILVKDPDDAADDFLLVPIHSADTASRRAVWILLDPVTLRLREASILENWTPPVFPGDEEIDKISSNSVSLADGTLARFKKSELCANPRNLVWKASGATILPYWPLQEIIAPHPQTGEPTSIYITQSGETHTVLGPEETPATQPPIVKPSSATPWILLAAIIGGACAFLLPQMTHTKPHPPVVQEIPRLPPAPSKPGPELPVQRTDDLTELQSKSARLAETLRKLGQELARPSDAGSPDHTRALHEAEKRLAELKSRYADLKKSPDDPKSSPSLESDLSDLTNQLKELQKTRTPK